MEGQIVRNTLRLSTSTVAWLHELIVKDDPENKESCAVWNLLIEAQSDDVELIELSYVYTKET